MNFHPYIAMRVMVDRIGLDPWDVCVIEIRSFMAANEMAPCSRHWFGSPCKFVRAIDSGVHVWLPAMLVDRYPELARYLRSTSPRWGRSWRKWQV
jgi:hypothetical protein